MKKGLLDLIIASICLAVAVLTFFYMREAFWLFLLSLCGFTLFVVLGIINRNKPLINRKLSDEADSYRGSIREVVLLNEENKELRSWDLFGRTAAVIGRDLGENLVDIDLSDATYASFVAVEHAVMNYAGEQWYIEDLHSKNGVWVEKWGDQNKYKLAPEKPCRLDAGDSIYIAQTKLFVR